jgi:hypothetical protein
MLRNPMPPCIQKPVVDTVSIGFENLGDLADHYQVISDCDVRHVLHQNRARLNRENDIDEGAPKLLAGVDFLSDAGFHEAADLRPSCPAEGLARRPACDEIDA